MFINKSFLVTGGLSMLWQSAYAGTIQLPQASTVAAGVDTVNDFVFWMSVFFTIVITGVMLLFIVKYHRSKKGRMTEQINHNTALEVIWTVIPAILMFVIAAWGIVEYKKMRMPMKGALEINVLGRQWLWNFQYTNGRQTMNDMYVPLGKPVKLIMTSEDVLHSFFIPNFRVKMDVVPGTYTALYFQATQLGEHKIFCTEYCGTSHSDMLGRVIVIEPEAFEEWLKTGRVPASSKVAAKTVGAPGSVTSPEVAMKSPAEKGAELYKTKTCVTCHSIDGSRLVGPTWKGTYGSKEELADGSSVTVDENYIRESIENPQAKVVKGYAPTMPTFKGLLTDDEINSLIAYIKSLK